MNSIWTKPPDIVAFTGGGLAREAGFAPSIRRRCRRACASKMS